MCGIWALLGVKPSHTLIETMVKQLEARGPEGTRITDVSGRITFGFTRLAINGLTDAGMQPYQSDQLSWMCNGEIYNSKAIEGSLDIQNAASDCECIGDLYLRHRDDLAAFARALDGVFALVIYDAVKRRLVVARDPYGVRPLYIAKVPKVYSASVDTFVFASELKALVPHYTDICVFPPGHIQVYDIQTVALVSDIEYHSVPWITHPQYRPCEISAACNSQRAIRYALEEAVRKRMLTDRPVAALLSGGLDSSLIAALVQQNLRQCGQPPLKTFTIGFKGSSDVAHARMVADWIGSDHTEIIMTPDDFFLAIPDVIKAIESFDTTTVRASVGNYMVAKKIKELSDCKVVFNGDGADELFGGYLYFNKAPNNEAFHSETARLLKDIHYFDVLRSDRTVSAHGLEARTPFLDKQFVAVVRSIHPELLRPVRGQQVEKYSLRSAFDDGVTLPYDVLWRRKEAFSDGVSGTEKAWFQEIQDRVAQLVPADWEERAQRFTHLQPKTQEEFYYRVLFDTYYDSSVGKMVVPYRWMPLWSPETTDPSARTLAIY